jgi:hypothetical protein
LTSGLFVNDTLTNLAGTFDAHDFDTYVGIQTTLGGGNYLASDTGNQLFDGNGLTVSGGTLTGGNGPGYVESIDVNLSSGTLISPTGDGIFYVYGNWSKTGGTFNTNKGTVVFNKGWGGLQTVDTGGVNFYNLGHKVFEGEPATLQLLSNVTVDNNFFNEKGDFDTNGMDATVAGLTTIAGGRYLTRTGQQNLNGGLSITGGTFTGSTGTVNTSNVSISGGVLFAPPAAGAFHVSGNWNKSVGGVFTPQWGNRHLRGQFGRPANAQQRRGGLLQPHPRQHGNPATFDQPVDGQRNPGRRCRHPRPQRQ